MKNLVILGTGRDDGNTLKAISELCPFEEYELIDLRKFRIGLYDYDSAVNAKDDFNLIAAKMKLADNILFATPVYWYAMSGVLKVFFDRLTDLLGAHKPIGKALKGKSTYLIATGTDTQLPPGFEVPFQLTSEYFEMKYQRAFYLKV